MKCTVLVENSSPRSELQTQHGLSFFIEHANHTILLDVGQNDVFAKNADTLNKDISSVDAVVCSHAHYDHVGGLQAFCALHSSAPIYTYWNGTSDYLSTTHCSAGQKERHIGFYIDAQYTDRLRLLYKSGVYSLFNGVWLVPMSSSKAQYGKPYKNKTLFERNAGEVGMHTDLFNHECALVIKIDSDRYVIFNSCSHTGVLNTIARVKKTLTGVGNKNIVAYVGGFHFPWNTNDTIAPEDCANMAELAKAITDESSEYAGIQLYSAHCTGEAAINYFEDKAAGFFTRIHTGFVLGV
ncbi:MAG TPA: MBL fold metallo-hydrolase [Treponemataceae bacterium]|nr:MBL fold metallo-hydrolase [Treponemataceae bacterium]